MRLPVSAPRPSLLFCSCLAHAGGRGFSWVRAALIGGLLSGALGACGGSQSDAESPLVAEARLRDTGPERPGETVAQPISELSREEVDRTVDAGLGQFLQGIEVSAVVEEEKFRGFRIERFHEPEKFRGVGLLVGDVVTAINGQAIETPEQAYTVFASLKTAERIDVSYLRAGHSMQLSLPIISHSAKAKSPAAPVKPAK